MEEVREPEIWKPIPGYEESYEVSSWGNVRSLEKKWKARYGKILIRKQMQLKPILVANYLRCCLYYETSKSKKKLIHILTAENFVENPNNYEQVNHIDCNPLNNYYKNLEWVSVRENQTHKFLNMKTSSEFVGVTYMKHGKRIKRWRAQININGKNKILGIFLHELDAKQAYLNALKEYGLTNKYAEQS